MVNWEGYERNQLWPISRYYTSMCEGTEKKHENQSGYPVFGPRFKPGNPKYRAGTFITPL
jgi:hypothetical protein